MDQRRHLLSISVLASVITGMLVFASLSFFAPRSDAASTTLVISQVYGGGGNSGATYRNDFIELFNRGTTTITLSGWTIQYASAAGTTWQSTSLTGTLAPGRYYLIQEAAGTGGTLNLPAADVTGTIALTATADKVALVSNSTPLTNTCPLSTTTSIVDFIGYGTTASCYEGSDNAPAPSNTTVILRAGNGCADTDNNANDFTTTTVQPRNSASPLNSCTTPPTNTPTRTATPTQTPTATPTTIAEKILITQVLYDGTQLDEGDEFVAIFNPLMHTVNLGGYKIGDEETKGSGESMYLFPPGTTLAPNSTLNIAKNAAQFRNRFGFAPAFELVTAGTLTDTASVPNLQKYTAWATGSIALSNSGDEVLLLGPSDQLVDAVAWGNGNFAAVGLRGRAKTDTGQSLQRYGTSDTNNMTLDFLHGAPNPSARVIPPLPPTPKPGAALPNGMFAFWGDAHAHSTVSDGSGPPRMAFDTARANGLHFFALTDHDSGLGVEEWDATGNAARDTTANGAFVGLRGFEYTNPNDGHLSVFNSATWVSHDDPRYDVLTEFYDWLMNRIYQESYFLQSESLVSGGQSYHLNPIRFS